MPLTSFVQQLELFPSCVSQCCREVQAAVLNKKPLILVHDDDTSLGGAPLDQLKGECPADVREALFSPASLTGVLPWLRKPAFQDETLLAIAEAVIAYNRKAIPDADHLRIAPLGSPRGSHRLARTGGTGGVEMPTPPARLTKRFSNIGGRRRKAAWPHGYVPAQLTALEFVFTKPLLIYVSEDNRGAEDLVRKLQQFVREDSKLDVATFPPFRQASAKRLGYYFVRRNRLSSRASNPNSLEIAAKRYSHDSTGAKRRGSNPGALALMAPSAAGERVCALIYLTPGCFEGEAGLRLLALVRELLASQESIILVHAVESCDFSQVMESCPDDLITAGLFRDIAVELRSGRHERVSLALLAKELGARSDPRRWKDLQEVAGTSRDRWATGWREPSLDEGEPSTRVPTSPGLGLKWRWQRANQLLNGKPMSCSSISGAADNTHRDSSAVV
jgi:hypothetical protein